MVNRKEVSLVDKTERPGSPSHDSSRKAQGNNSRTAQHITVLLLGLRARAPLVIAVGSAEKICEHKAVDGGVELFRYFYSF